ncbi:MAG: DUF983 domain-containing protein [Flavobacteriales bacterium]|nr:DUF983 domain-containing protein [Flavobacteriales bacterium]MCB9190916.1 DUF983 domain-containing protein [Flavobacteriales bacterium]
MKTGILSSVFQNKCPRCRQGDLFLTKNPYNFSNIDKMPDNCPNCGQKYWIEPGFYYGAMYISYALTIALSVAIFVAMIVLWHFDIKWYLALNFSTMIILFPPIFRLSRSIWAHIYIRPDKEQTQEKA